MKARLILWAILVGESFQSYSYRRHLTTDPVCVEYRAPRAGSRLDRVSRGVSCTPCMVTRAFRGES